MPKKGKPKRGAQNASKRQTRKRVNLTQSLTNAHAVLSEVILQNGKRGAALRDLLGFYDRTQMESGGWTAADTQRLAEIRELVK